MNLYKKLFLGAFVIFLALLSAGAVMAWTGPLSSPPTCTSGNPGCDAPLNVANSAQIKAGGSITVSGGGALGATSITAGAVGFCLPGSAPTGGCITTWPSGGTSQWTTGSPGIYYSGIVGIGTSAPLPYTLDVKTGTDQHLVARPASAFNGGLTGIALQSTNDANNAYKNLDLEAGQITLNVGSGGNVGIGTTNPGATLEVQGTSNSAYSSSAVAGNPRVRIINTDTTNNNTSALALAANDSGGTPTSGAAISAIFTNHAAGATSADLAFQTRNAGTLAEAMRITRAGNVGIGTAAPASKLDVEGGNINVSAGIVTGYGSGSDTTLNYGVLSTIRSDGLYLQYGNTGPINFYNNLTAIAQINGSGLKVSTGGITFPDGSVQTTAGISGGRAYEGAYSQPASSGACDANNPITGACSCPAVSTGSVAVQYLDWNNVKTWMVTCYK